MTYQNIGGGGDEERVVVNIECSLDTFVGWHGSAGVDEWDGPDVEGFAEGYASYEQAVLDAHRTWDVIHHGIFSRGDFAGTDEPGTEKNIFIRCSVETRQKFKEFAAGYDDYEAAVEDVVRSWREAPNYFKGRSANPS